MYAKVNTMKQSSKSINKTLAKLRAIVEADKDPIETRIAYAVECAIRWATEDTNGWKRPEDDVRLESGMVKNLISKETNMIAGNIVITIGGVDYRIAVKDEAMKV